MRSFPASLRGPVERCELRRAASSRWGVRQVDLRKRHSNSMNWKIGSRGGRGAVPTRNGTNVHRPYSATIGSHYCQDRDGVNMYSRCHPRVGQSLAVGGRLAVP